MTYYVIAVDHNEGTNENPVMRTDYINKSYLMNRIMPYQTFVGAKQFESIDEAKLFFKKNKEDILGAHAKFAWGGEPSNFRIVEVKTTNCLDLS